MGRQARSDPSPTGGDFRPSCHSSVPQRPKSQERQQSDREEKEAEPPRGTGRRGAVLRLVPGELRPPGPSMQFPTGPACIFLRKGIAEKQRVRRAQWEGGRAQWVREQVGGA